MIRVFDEAIKLLTDKDGKLNVRGLYRWAREMPDSQMWLAAVYAYTGERDEAA
jgi:hypothetical protein